MKRYDVKATFFVLGSSVVQNPGLVKRELDEGHQVGSHSWDHPQLTKLSEQEVYNQILQTQKVVFDQTGYFPTTMRPPYGAVNKRLLMKLDFRLFSGLLIQKIGKIKTQK